MEEHTKRERRVAKVRAHKNPKTEVIWQTYNFPDGKNDDRWYHWCIENWGTKWDADILGLDVQDYDTLEISFNTAWSPPEGVVKNCVKSSQNLHFNVSMMNELRNCGVLLMALCEHAVILMIRIENDYGFLFGKRPKRRKAYQPDLYYYWHGDIEEDYDMGDYTCLCEICFDINNSEGKIAWKDDKNPFECTSL